MKLGCPHDVVDTLLNSLAPQTAKQYHFSLNAWMAFCHQQSLDPLDVNTLNVLKFLQHILDTSVVGYSSLNTHRAALSLIAPHNLTDDPLIKRFMKGVFRQRPPRAKYDSTWDPDLILTFLKAHTDLSLPFVTKKLAILLLLATGQRLQTIWAIQIDKISFSGSGATIAIPEILKTTRPGTVAPLLVLPTLPTCPQICVPTCLRKYLKLTAPFRGRELGLFLTFRPPHGPATRVTIARWVRDIMREAGIDTSVFKAHSTRHAAVSKAHEKDVPLETIFKAAGWSSKSSMFAKIYCRPIALQRSFAEAIICPPAVVAEV